MPRYSMNWEGHPAYRWSRMYRGTRYRVSCDELRCERTKEASYKAANKWWQDKLQAIYSQENHLEETAKILVGKEPPPKFHPDLIPIINAISQALSSQDNAVITEQLRFINQNIGIVPKQDGITTRESLASFLKIEKTRLKPASYRELSDYLYKILNASILPISITGISEATVIRHFEYLAEQERSPEQKNKYIGFFRRFIQSLYSDGYLQRLPNNLKDKRHRFKVIPKAIKTFDNVKETLDALPEKQKLWALLGLNTGMTPVDMGMLKWEQIDLEQGLLTRRRIKTEAQQSVPTVTYKLWAETLAGLKALPQNHELVFVTRNNQPMYHSDYDATGKAYRFDMFSRKWRNVKPRPAIPLGKFRSISATILKKHILYRNLVPYFLGHSPKSVADKHYAAEDDDIFFEALGFIRHQIYNSK